MVMKYLAIVGLSCFLAFFISHTIASAQEARQTITNAVTSADGQVTYSSPGAFNIETSLASWMDASRAREVLVKLYFPIINSAMAPATKFPVILFSHGLGGSREGGKRWAAHWASHGFVVVAMQHPGSDESLWKGIAARDITGSMKAGMSFTNLGLRVGDVHFVIDEVFRRTAVGEAAFENADSKRLGMSGHSFGAQTTLSVVGQKPPLSDGKSGLDSRISAAIAFSPNARNKSNLARQFGDIKLPFFSITGSDDGRILDDGTKPENRRLPYENMAPGQKYLAVFDVGDHMVFGGHAFGQRRPETPRDKAIQAGVMAGTLAFWHATLKQDIAARRWFEQGGFHAALGSKDTFEQK